MQIAEKTKNVLKALAALVAVGGVGAILTESQLDGQSSTISPEPVVQTNETSNATAAPTNCLPNTSERAARRLSTGGIAEQRTGVARYSSLRPGSIVVTNAYLAGKDEFLSNEGAPLTKISLLEGDAISLEVGDGGADDALKNVYVNGVSLHDTISNLVTRLVENP